MYFFLCIFPVCSEEFRGVKGQGCFWSLEHGTMPFILIPSCVLWEVVMTMLPWQMPSQADNHLLSEHWLRAACGATGRLLEPTLLSHAKLKYLEMKPPLPSLNNYRYKYEYSSPLTGTTWGDLHCVLCPQSWHCIPYLSSFLPTSTPPPPPRHSLPDFSREHFLNKVFLNEPLSKVLPFCRGRGRIANRRQTII